MISLMFSMMFYYGLLGFCIYTITRDSIWCYKKKHVGWVHGIVYNTGVTIVIIFYLVMGII
jgi:hypothetical protein